MEKYLIIIFGFFLLLACKNEPPDIDPPPPPPDTTSLDIDFITGMDLSYQSFLAPYSVPYKDEQGQIIDNIFDFVQDNGVNLIRVRLFHSPQLTDSILYASRLEAVLELCKEIKNSGNQILLDLHYSDSWADPGKQSLPVAWENLSFSQLQDSIYQYTRFVLEKMAAQQSLPYMVQIGNETNSGFLWDQGKVWGAFDDNWPQYSQLINEANRAIKEVAGLHQTEILSMVHVAGILSVKNFFEQLDQQGASFDIIGLSHYSHFHSQDLLAIQIALKDLADRFSKPILIAETSYPFTLDWNDFTHNWVGQADQLIDGYDATPEGQAAYFERLSQILQSVPNDLGIGFVWWAPDMVAFNGPQSQKGSHFENLTVFDFENQALPVFKVFQDY